MMERDVVFGSGPQLVGRWGEPKQPKAALVFSHPHPLMGGTMSNNVVRLCCHWLNRMDIATLRYDFRGAGESGGEHDGGAGEVEDVLSAVAQARWLLAESNLQLPLVLAGYSFGSWVNWRALQELNDLSGLVLVSPPMALDPYHFTPYPDLKIPALALVGDRDEFLPGGAVAPADRSVVSTDAGTC